MKTLLNLEEVAMFLMAILLFNVRISYAWWVFPACLLLPDLSMIGYAAGNKVGAVVYNFFHHKGIALLVYLAGHLLGFEWLAFAGIILFAHSCMDRVFGYGLKYMTGFKDTHLGEIGPRK
ncbi:DUF4260 domain-containing protein [Chitinophaga oryzae]|uniref:DUF4260 domain-containing protein n=1 Tax=Chitinophaga oryzae TaxID=2725414 RepID=A0AAE7D804_9BACT|nr:DUF4260 domain-containing protein [Chitinophaga oryzae]QJB32249.1 DUF4260 domain-containing protein [Chitinophaga oryzae]QJB38710.1 DUF4260 domain-containing protein [Chitinophaga oryzae]